MARYDSYEEVPIYKFKPYAPLTIYSEWGGKGQVKGNTSYSKNRDPKYKNLGMHVTQQVGGWLYLSQYEGWVNMNDLEPEDYYITDPSPNNLWAFKDGMKVYEEKKQDELRLAELYIELEKYKGDWESLLAKGRINGLHIEGPSDVVPISLSFNENDDFGWDHGKYVNRDIDFEPEGRAPMFVGVDGIESSSTSSPGAYPLKINIGETIITTPPHLPGVIQSTRPNYNINSPVHIIHPVSSADIILTSVAPMQRVVLDTRPPDKSSELSLNDIRRLNLNELYLGGSQTTNKISLQESNLNTHSMVQHQIQWFTQPQEKNLNTLNLNNHQTRTGNPFNSENLNTKPLAGSQTRSGGSGVPVNNLNNLPIAIHRKVNNSKGVNNLYFDYRYGSSQFIESSRSKPLSSVDDYAMFGHSIQTIKNNLNIFDENAYRQVNTRFNRYRLPLPDQHLPRTVPYIFFTRPNIKFTSKTNELQGQYGVDSMFRAIYDQNVEIFNNMELQSHTQHQFNTILGSMARSFEVSDEVIKTIDTGETYTGWKMTYGRNSNESNTASQIGIQYIDDKDLRVYYMHKIWVEYINKVYRGDFQPAREMIINKTLDYATAIYYIVCAADGESILYWAKYYGVFPINTPASVFSWTHGSPQTAPEFTINYAYSMKVEMQPSILAEFNMHSPLPFKYRPIYDKRIMTNTPTFVGPPFVERLALKNKKFEYKLRFRN